MCEKAKKIIAKAKAKTKGKKSAGPAGPGDCGASAKLIEDLRRKVEDKNKDAIKVKEESVQQIADMQKDCNQRFT